MIRKFSAHLENPEHSLASSCNDFLICYSPPFMMADGGRPRDRAVRTSQTVGSWTGWLLGQRCLQKHSEDAGPLPGGYNSITQTVCLPTIPPKHMGGMVGRCKDVSTYQQSGRLHWKKTLQWWPGHGRGRRDRRHETWPELRRDCDRVFGISPDQKKNHYLFYLNFSSLLLTIVVKYSS